MISMMESDNADTSMDMSASHTKQTVIEYPTQQQMKMSLQPHHAHVRHQIKSKIKDAKIPDMVLLKVGILVVDYLV